MVCTACGYMFEGSLADQVLTLAQHECITRECDHHHKTVQYVNKLFYAKTFDVIWKILIHISYDSTMFRFSGHITDVDVLKLNWGHTDYFGRLPECWWLYSFAVCLLVSTGHNCCASVRKRNHQAMTIEISPVVFSSQANVNNIKKLGPACTKIFDFFSTILIFHDNRMFSLLKGSVHMVLV